MKVAILGAGQLSQMLVEAAIPMGIELSVLADAPDSPASLVASNVTVGSFDVPTLGAFMQGKTHVLFESEFVDTDLLTRASEELDVTFIPSLSVMSLFQDKLSQKEFCVAHSLPTSPFAAYVGGDVGKWCERVVHDLGGECVFKWATLGYDGKGNFFARGDYDSNALKTFVEQALKRKSRVYAERLIKFKDEAAIVGVRSSKGECAQYPVVYSEQTQGICLSVKGPATSLGLNSQIAGKIAEIARSVGDKGGIVGVYAVELFLTDNEIFINEIAPRVHNTGHYTQDACSVSQFENHIRACLGMQIGKTDTKPFFAMRNILGPNITLDTSPPPAITGKAKLHWYGKRGLKHLRKLGHINAVADSKEALEVRISEMIEDEKRWVRQISS